MPSPGSPRPLGAAGHRALGPGAFTGAHNPGIRPLEPPMAPWLPAPYRPRHPQTPGSSPSASPPLPGPPVPGPCSPYRSPWLSGPPAPCPGVPDEPRRGRYRGVRPLPPPRPVPSRSPGRAIQRAALGPRLRSLAGGARTAARAPCTCAPGRRQVAAVATPPGHAPPGHAPVPVRHLRPRARRRYGAR